jgi:ABC-type spermidine/putrescine transport system permease subunit I
MTGKASASPLRSGIGTVSPGVGSLLLTPNLLFLALVLLAPLGIVAAYSFMTYSPDGTVLPTATLANYRQLADPYYIRLLAGTAGIALKVTLACVVIGYPVAYFLARASRTVALVGMLVLMAPLMVSAVVRAFGWLVLLGRNGIVNSLLVSFGLAPVELLYSESAVLLGLVHMLLPFMVLPLMASIERIPPSVEEAAENLGAHPLQTFLKVILPLSVPGLISGAFLVYVESASAFVMPALLGGRQVRMVGSEVFDKMLTAFNFPVASMLTITLIVFTGSVVAMGSLLTARLARRG